MLESRVNEKDEDMLGDKQGSYFFDRVFDDISSRDDFAPLAHPVDSVKCLLLCHWAPLRFEEVDARCRRQIQSSNDQSM